MTAIKKVSTNNTYAMVDRCTSGSAFNLYYRTNADGDYTVQGNWNTIALTSDEFADLEIVNDSIYCTEYYLESGFFPRTKITRINTDGTTTVVLAATDTGAQPHGLNGDLKLSTVFSPETGYFYIGAPEAVVYSQVDSNNDLTGPFSELFNVEDAYDAGVIDYLCYKPNSSGEILVNYQGTGSSPDYFVRSYNGTTDNGAITPSYFSPYVYHKNGFYVGVYDASTLVVVETDGTEHTYSPLQLSASGDFVKGVVCSNTGNRFYIVMRKSGSPDFFAIEIIDGDAVDNLASQGTINTPIAASDFYINTGTYNSLFMVPHTRQNDSYVWFG